MHGQTDGLLLTDNFSIDIKATDIVTPTYTRWKTYRAKMKNQASLLLGVGFAVRAVYCARLANENDHSALQNVPEL